MPDMTAGALLRQAVARLQASGCETPALDARLLLLRAADLTHARLIADEGRQLTPAEAEALSAMVQRRVAGEPVARILGEREFYGRVFEVTPDVLDPRADTETLVDAVLPLLRPMPAPRMLDIGTGSGAIIATLLAEMPRATGVATDVSAAALDVARRNAQRLGVSGRLEVRQTSWAAGCEGPFDLIVSNPPYIVSRDIASLALEVRGHDPHVALDGGIDGLEAYRALLPQAASMLAETGHIGVEFGAGQHEAVIAIARDCGLEPSAASGGLHADLGGHIRCVIFARS